MASRATHALLWTAVFGFATVSAFADPAASARSDGYFARELARLGQKNILKSAAASAKGSPQEPLYDSAYIFAAWPDLIKTQSREQLGQAYLADVQKILDSKDVDGFWALDQAKFIFARLTDPVVTRIEYFGASAADRAKLLPMATIADQLLTIANDKIPALMSTLENAKPFNEMAYMTAYNANGEIGYNQAFAEYFKALALKSDAPDRAGLLSKATDLLGQWADGDDSSGVKWQALLLRGKVNSESAKYPDALKDLTAAENPAGPGWVQYQAHYQIVVTHIRNNDFESATAELEKFKAWVDQTQGKNPAAAASLDMLDYRLESAKAGAIADPAARAAAQAKAMDILTGIIEKTPAFRDLVFQQLAAAVPDGADLTKLPPLQTLAVASSLVQSADPNTLEGKKQLSQASDLALSVRNADGAAPSNQREAALIAAVANTKLQRLLEAAKSNVDFAELSLQNQKVTGVEDPRAKQLVEAALDQIGQILKTQQQPSKELNDLKEKALALATGNFNDPRWLYAQAITLEEAGKLDEAATTFDSIRSDDPNYMDARYRLLRINLHRMNQATDDAVKKAAAQDLMKACRAYLNPPANLPQSERDAVKQYRNDILLIEVATALTPLGDAATAQKILDELEAQGNLSTQMQGAILRYRLLAYQVEGKPDEATKTVQKYVDQFPEQGTEILKGMIAKNIEEIDDAEKQDPEKAKVIAGQVVTLLQSLIDWAGNNLKQDPNNDKKKADYYSYRQILGDMLVRAGNSNDAIVLFDDLQKERPDDLFNFMGEARAIFAAKRYPEAHDYFVRLIPKLAPGSESFWEAYLRVLQSNEAMGKNTDSTQKALNDLRVSYGDAIGGKQYKREYRELMDKYHIP